MCRYTFINPKLDQTITSISSSDDNNNPENKSRVFSFDHENVKLNFYFEIYARLFFLKEYTFPIADQFLSACLDSSVSIEVWYQYKTIPPSINTTIDNNEQTRRIAEVKKLGKLWKDVKRYIQFSIEIHELDGLGQWSPVDVDVQQQIISGGVYRLKQVYIKNKISLLHLSVLSRVNQDVLKYVYIYFLHQVQCHLNPIQYNLLKLVQLIHEK
jgi:hypothetical protein